MRVRGRLIVDALAPAAPGSFVAEGGRIKELDCNPLASPHSAKPDRSRPASAGCIVSGFIDAHLHPLEVGLELLQVNLTGTRTIAEVLERISQRRVEATEWGMLLAFNLEPDNLLEGCYPCRRELDRVVADVPVLVYRVDGHSAVVNTVGLDLLLRDRAPFRLAAGVELDRHGEPTGVLRGAAYEQASRWFKRRLPQEMVDEALLCCGQDAVRQGVTTIAALIGTEETTTDEFRVMLDTLGRGLPAAVPFVQSWNHEHALAFGLKRIGGCLLIDGSFGSHTAALSQDYADAPGTAGTAFVPDEKLVHFLRRSEELGLQTSVHAIGDRAVEQVVRCHESVGGSSLRHRIEHAELLNPGLVRRIARLGLVLGVQPAFEAVWGGPDRMYSCRLGTRWRMTNPFRDLLAAGVILAGGSDAPITPVAPLLGIKAAIEHPNTEQRVTPEQALAMFTQDAALSLGLEDETGRLAPGLRADFAVLTDDPRTGSDCRVAAAFRAGRCVLEDHALLGSLDCSIEP
jgi:hypothetical protein